MRFFAMGAVVFLLLGLALARAWRYAFQRPLSTWPIVDTIAMTQEARLAMRMPRSVVWTGNKARNMSALVDDMRSAMRRHRVSCLPANFVGVPVRVVAINDGMVLINPEIVQELGSAARVKCDVDDVTSFGFPLVCETAPTVIVEYLSESFLTRRTTVFDDWKAACVQLAMKQF